jgi:hypothetical protein
MLTPVAPARPCPASATPRGQRLRSLRKAEGPREHDRALVLGQVWGCPAAYGRMPTGTMGPSTHRPPLISPAVSISVSVLVIRPSISVSQPLRHSIVGFQRCGQPRCSGSRQAVTD